MNENNYVRWFDELGAGDVDQVGGKNASLGEMFNSLSRRGLRVPDGFATTVEAYWKFVEHNNIDPTEGEREKFEEGEFPGEVASAISEAYAELCRRHDRENLDVAARSSATAEDLPEASFAGQQDTFLNLRGADQVLDACRGCFASLFNKRAVSYREEQGFAHDQVGLSVGVQKMVRSDQATAGVMLTLDTETGFPDLVVINASWGLGEAVVAGEVNPDEYRVYKPFLRHHELTPIVTRSLGSKAVKYIYTDEPDNPIRQVDTDHQERHRFVLSDEEILSLARWACVIEEHYEKPMDIEWAKDGIDGLLYIVQARPETVRSREKGSRLRTYTLREEGEVLLRGVAIGRAIASGKVRVLESPEEGDSFKDGELLVTHRTDPDWVPVMRRAAGIITDSGGRTSHAAIVSRELGLPALVGSEEGTSKLAEVKEATLSCAEGQTGRVYRGLLDYEVDELDPQDLPCVDTDLMINIADPDAAFKWWALPCDGVGLLRLEFLINHTIGVHPMALVKLDELADEEVREEIEELTRAYREPTDFFVHNLARGMGQVAASRYPDPVVVRTSDFKTNEYADLIGGKFFEPEEANPMLGFRGASRYYSDEYRPAFELECRALKMAREELGFDNLIVMIPFCRTPSEADRVLKLMAQAGLVRGQRKLQVFVMVEIPSNVVLAEEFAHRFDGFSIGSNDLTQLVLAVDRDSDRLAELFDERHPAVKAMIARVIEVAHQHGVKVGICGQAPSDYPDFAAFLSEAGIDSISVNPDSLAATRRRLAELPL